MNFLLMTSILTIAKIESRRLNMHLPLYNRRTLLSRIPAANLAMQHHLTMLHNQCYVNNVWTTCRTPKKKISDNATTTIDRMESNPHEQQDSSDLDHVRTSYVTPSTSHSPFRRMIDMINSNVIQPLHEKLDGSIQNHASVSPLNDKLNLKLENYITKLNSFLQTTTESSKNNATKTTASKENLDNLDVSTAVIDVDNSTRGNSSRDETLLEKFSESLASFEQRFYATTFSKLSQMSPPARRENGMSYVQSGLFLQLALMALSTEVGPDTRREIDQCLQLNLTDQERLDVINATVSSLPVSSDDLKFRWSSRLVLRSQNVSERFRTDAAPALRLHIDSFNGTETPKEMADALNHMVEIDTGGAIHNTFEEEDVPAETRAVLVSTLYVRARWRSAPTLLNGTRAFRDEGGTRRAARMIRLNDAMRYARLDRWDAEALEIQYSTPGLSLLMLVPRGTSLRRLAAAAANTSLADITARMQPLRVAASLPLYTLRMTLLLPNKLQAMNVSRLVSAGGGPEGELRLSLAVQRIMFWAEAGRNAFKDDGVEWDEHPQRELVVDRPYIFYVRWKNKTILNGNFVL